jgi:hypothetical protein
MTNTDVTTLLLRAKAAEFRDRRTFEELTNDLENVLLELEVEYDDGRPVPDDTTRKRGGTSCSWLACGTAGERSSAATTLPRHPSRVGGEAQRPWVEREEGILTFRSAG